MLALLDPVEFEALTADRAYDSNDLRNEMEERGVTVLDSSQIEGRVEAIDYDTELYKWRHLVENK